MTVRAEHWAFRIPRTNADRAGILRSIRDTQMAVVDDVVWVKGKNLDEALLSILAAIADGPVFVLTEEFLLTPVRQTVPTDHLPQCNFVSAKHFFHPTLPIPQLPREFSRRVQLKLIRCPVEHPAEFWRGAASTFKEWVETSPAIRLQQVRYAVSSGETPEIIARGNPLPPLPGRMYWLAGQVALPLGWHWSPMIDQAAMNEIILQSINASSQETIVIWQQSTTETLHDQLEAIARTSFVPTTRSSVRQIHPITNRK